MGLRRALRLIPIVLLCYLAVVMPLMFWGVVLIQHLPLLRPILTFGAAIWVAALAIKLWTLTAPTDATATAVSSLHLAITTLLNPKSLIFGLILLPSATPPLAGLLAFACFVPLVSAIWLAIGARLLTRAGPWLNKASALWLATLALILAAKSLTI